MRGGCIGHKTKLHRLPTVRCVYSRGVFAICEHSKQQLVRKVSMGRDEMEIAESALAFKSIRARVKHKGGKHGRKEKVRERSTAGNKASSRFVPMARIRRLMQYKVRYEIARSAPTGPRYTYVRIPAAVW